jgi:hypothetical protein
MPASSEEFREFARLGGGFVESLAHPGSNATGFSNFEYGVAGNQPEHTWTRPDVCRPKCDGMG